MAGTIKRSVVLVILAMYTVFAGGPVLWAVMLSLRTTSEINLGQFDLPNPIHWEKYPDAWVNSNYGTYFANSVEVVLISVAALTIIGAMAAHALARYRFRFNRVIYFVLFSSIVFPPQITIIALFQILVSAGLFNSKLGLILVYISVQLPLTIYILESFFARIPNDLFDAARMDGYSDFEIFFRVALPVASPAVATSVILNFLLLWNEFLYAVVLITDDDNRTLPLGIQRFVGDTQLDIGMLATGLMISIIPVIVLYALFSEKIVQGMTAGAVK